MGPDEQTPAAEIRALRDLDLSDYYWRDFPPPVSRDASIHVHGHARALALERLRDRHKGLGPTVPPTFLAGALMLEIEAVREDVHRLSEIVAKTVGVKTTAERRDTRK